MNIYKLNNKEMKNQIVGFNQSNYGFTVFVLAYFIPLLITLTTILLTLLFVICYRDCWACYAPILLGMIVALLFTFILGSRYYYRELRIFINSQSKATGISKLFHK